MLNYARSLVGKPFSNVGMARSILYPRKTDGESFFCAGKLLNRPQTPPTHPTLQLFNGPKTQLSWQKCLSTRRQVDFSISHLGNLDQTTTCRVLFLEFFIFLTLGAPVCLCAELVAAILKKGGLMSSTSNPGAATPQSLHRLYKNQAAATANPYTLRQFNNPSSNDAERSRLLGFQGMMDRPVSARQSAHTMTSRKRGDSPPRASFRCVSTNSMSSHGR